MVNPNSKAIKIDSHSSLCQTQPPMGLALSLPIRLERGRRRQMPTTSRQDQTLLDTVIRSSVRLPPSFIVWRSPNAPTLRRWDAVLVRAHTADDRGPGVWRFLLEQAPLLAIGTGHMTPSTADPWFEGREHTILVDRRMRRGGPNPLESGFWALKPTTVRYAGWTLYSVSTDEAYPVLYVTNAADVLPDPFEQIREPVHASWRFEAAPGLVDRIAPAFRTLMTTPSLAAVPNAAAPPSPVLTPPAPRVGGPVDHEDLVSEEEGAGGEATTASATDERRGRIRHAMAVHEVALAYSHLMDRHRELQRDLRKAKAEVKRISVIPQHVANSHIEVLISRGDTCPLMLNPLEKEFTCLTPCGHAMALDVGTKWIEVAEECPVCREVVKATQLQRWVG